MQNKQNNLNFLAKCSFCNKKFVQSEMLLLNEQENKTIFHTTCSKCNTSTLVFLSSNEKGIVSVGMSTDLTGKDAKIFFGKEAINADEIIDMYQLISDNKIYNKFI